METIEPACSSTSSCQRESWGSVHIISGQRTLLMSSARVRGGASLSGTQDWSLATLQLCDPGPVV